LNGQGPLLWFFLAALAISAALKWILASINIGHLRKNADRVPEGFAGEIDTITLSRMSRYTAENSRFGSMESLFGNLVILAAVLSGFFPWLAARVDSAGLHPILSGLVFFGILGIADALLDIPFDAYRTFGIEKKYGFSTITPHIWAVDLLKGFLVSAVLLSLLLAPLLALIRWSAWWWFFAWIFFLAFQLLMLWLYPVLIAPLFNKYEPVRDEALRGEILDLARRGGIHVEGVFQMDAAKRSRHSNAYFTGIGRTKRIVLFDTLLKSHSRQEILAVLAHEIGHWTRKHVLKQILFLATVSFLLFFLSSLLLYQPQLYRDFGFGQTVPYAGLFLVVLLFQPIIFLLTPAGAAMSRNYELQADDESVRLLGGPDPLIAALKRLAKDNLANLHPHPLFAWFYYSHPPLVGRISRLRGGHVVRT